MSHASPTPQIWFKNQRVWRTILTAVVALIPVVPQVLMILDGAFPNGWFAAALAQYLVYQGLLTRLIANEKINAWLTKYTWFGSSPKTPPI